MAMARSPKPRRLINAGRNGAALSFLIAALLAVASAMLVACNGQRTVTPPDGSLPDTAQPTTCGFGVHVPEFDHQCKGGTGCRYIEQPPTCGCGCAACDGEMCVRTWCAPQCKDGDSAALDGGSIVFDSGNDANDGGLPYSKDCAADGGKVPDVAPIWQPPFGPHAELITADAYVARAHGDNIVWSTPPRRVGSLDVADLCYYSIKTGQTRCLCLDENEYDITRFEPHESMITWILRRHEPNGPFLALDYIELNGNSHRRAAGGAAMMICELAVYGGTVVYYVCDNNQRKVLPLFKYDKTSGVVEQLSNQGRPGGVCLFGSDLVYAVSFYKGKEVRHLFHYDLMTNTEKQLNATNTDKLVCGGMWGRRFVYMDWRGKYGPGPDVVMYDLDSDQEYEIDAKQYGQWFPSIYENLVMWTDLSTSGYVEGGPGQLWILDLATNVRRQVTTVAGDYSAQVFSHKHFIVTTEAGNPGGVPYYLFDLEKAGIVKDGHVVAE